VGSTLRMLGIDTARPSGLVSDGLVFATNLVFLTPATGWLESLVQRTFGDDDPVAGHQLAIWLTVVVALQAAGAFLKRRPLQSRLKGSNPLGGATLWLLLFNYILTLLIMSTIVATVWDQESPWPIFVVLIAAVIPTYLINRALSPVERRARVPFLDAPWIERVADLFLLTYVVTNTMFFNLLTGFKATPPASIGDVITHLLSLFVVLFIVLLWYLPPRMLFLVEEARDRGAWLRMLIAMSPIAFRWVVG
jgi:hypothetical protein